MTISNQHIVVTGFMATGKSTVSVELSQILKIPWLDLDQEIENNLQRKISEIFTTNGESYFRHEESKSLAKALARNTRTVIATGGGTLVNESNRALAKKNSHIFCLQASLDTLSHRLNNSSRPLASQWQGILEKRKEIYMQFPHQIQVDQKTPLEIAQEIKTIWQQISM